MKGDSPTGFSATAQSASPATASSGIHEPPLQRPRRDAACPVIDLTSPPLRRSPAQSVHGSGASTARARANAARVALARAEVTLAAALLRQAEDDEEDELQEVDARSEASTLAGAAVLDGAHGPMQLTQDNTWVEPQGALPAQAALAIEAFDGNS